MSVGILTTGARFSQAGCLEPVGLEEPRPQPSDQLREAFTGGHGRSPFWTVFLPASQPCLNKSTRIARDQ